jgi:hypothetical protein
MGSMSCGARAAIIGASALGLTAIVAAPAQAATTTFSNATPITIPGTGTVGPASPYPSNIDVTSLAGTVLDVNATLNGFSHTFPADVNVALAGPGGRQVTLTRAAGDGDDVTNLTLTFDDEAAGPLPSTGPLTSGTYTPSGPGTLANLNGASANGTYSLFVDDNFSGDSGSISGGWSLELTTFDTTVTSGPKDTTRKKTATFGFAADGLPGATFECALDGRSAFRPCTSPTTVRVKKGRHIFQVQATVEGVTDTTPATDEWKVKKKKKR